MVKIVKNSFGNFLVIFVIFSLIFGWFFSGWPRIWQKPPIPPEVKVANAAVPAGVIIAWPGTNLTIPNGWQRVTDFDTYFLEGTTTTPVATVFGTSTHSHTSPSHTHSISSLTHSGNTGAAGGTAIQTKATPANASAPHLHTHTTSVSTSTVTYNNATSSQFGTASNGPPYTEVIFIESLGSTEMPTGTWAFFANDTLPTSWSRQSAGRFLKGAAALGNGGGTGGLSDSHTHTDSGHIHTENSHTHNVTTVAVVQGLLAGSGTSGTIAPGSHSHTISGGDITATEQSNAGVINTADGQPPFMYLNIIQNDNTAADTPQNIIAMWAGSVDLIPDYWYVCDGTNGTPNLNGKYVKGASAGQATTTGGNLTHSHTASTTHTHTVNSHDHTFTVNNNTSRTTLATKVAVDASPYSHTHSFSLSGGGTTGSQTVTADANTDNRPLSKGIVYIQYQPAVISITVGPTEFNYGVLGTSATKRATASGVTAGIIATSTSNVNVDFTIYGADATSTETTWTLSDTAIGTDIYMHEFGTTTSPSVWTKATTTAKTLATGVVPNAAQIFDLRINTPSLVATTGIQLNVPITIVVAESS